MARPPLPATLLLAAGVALLATGCMSGVRREIDASIAEARTDLHRDPMVLHADGKPDATITAKGRFAIEGQAMGASDEQRRAAREYRAAMVAYGDAALDVATREAWPLARRATVRALFGVFTGTSEAADRRIEEDSARLGAKVTRLCPQLMDAWSAQESLARLLPEFRPYADLDREEVAQCMG